MQHDSVRRGVRARHVPGPRSRHRGLVGFTDAFEHTSGFEVQVANSHVCAFGGELVEQLGTEQAVHAERAFVLVLLEDAQTHQIW